MSEKQLSLQSDYDSLVQEGEWEKTELETY